MRKAKVLIVYVREFQIIRKTIEDSIFCFGQYCPYNVEVFYYSYQPDMDMDSVLKHMQFDVVIFHSIFIFQRSVWDQQKWNRTIDRFASLWTGAKKVLIAQDEQYLTVRIHEFINKVKIDTLITCANRKTTDILYPAEKVNLKQIITVLPGYVDEKLWKKVRQIEQKEKIRRDIDIGYRTDKTPYALGYLGRQKTLVTEVFNEVAKKYPMQKLDVKNTVNGKNAYFGLDWFRFLLRCRTVIVCPGGASIQDAKGEIRWRVNAYQKKNQNATYEEIDRDVLKVYGDPIDYSSITPRFFDAAMTKTCQILIEGDYIGEFQSDIHYIELKKDFSNLDDVLKRVQDKNLCRRIAETAYRDIVLSGKYTYRRYVQNIFRLVIPSRLSKDTFGMKLKIIHIILGLNNIIVDRFVVNKINS